jgi:hypothetical protein
MNKLILASAIMLSLAAPSLSFAQTDPGHPRVNEVNQRLENQQDRIDAGVKDGQITPKAAAADEKRDANIAKTEAKDEAKNGGHLTKKEQRHLNKRLNHNSKKIHNQRHKKGKK